MADLVGKTLKNQYYLRRLVGSGAMADVYEAFDKVRATKMAVKVLRRDLAMDHRFVRAFQNEAQKLIELQHPNIVRLYEFETKHAPAFIVMAWVDGSDLKARLAEHGQPFSLGEVAAILNPVTSALNFAHQMKIIHCDIKPSNILLSVPSHEVLLTDFGVARRASEQTGGGTVPYMAPEQLTDGIVSSRTDIYALGVTVYQMLSGGQVPFSGNPQSPGDTTKKKIAWEQVNMALPDLRNYNPALSQRVISVIEKALKKNPRERYSTAIEFLSAFEAARGIGGYAADASRTLFQPFQPVTSSPTKQPGSSRTGEASLPAPQPGTQKGVPYLYGRSGERAGHIIPIPRQGLTIGRATKNQLRLLDRTVSRSHARIIRTQRRVYIQDENSTAGTYVNERRIPVGRPIPLNHRDVIRAGYYQVFEFRVK